MYFVKKGTTAEQMVDVIESLFTWCSPKEIKSTLYYMGKHTCTELEGNDGLSLICLLEFLDDVEEIMEDFEPEELPGDQEAEEDEKDEDEGGKEANNAK